LNVEVEQIWPAENGFFRIGFQDAGEEVQVEADTVLFAGASFRTAKLLRPFNERVAAHLDLIPYAPIAIVFLGFQKNQLKHPLDGFGFLVPQVEKRKILGAIFSSTIFPNRAPGNGAALTVFVGGTRQPQLIERNDKDLLKMVQDELHSLLGLTSDPDFHWIKRWQRSIPQYNLGHWKIQEEMNRFEKDFPGLFITGNFREGISVADCVAHAEKIAIRISEFCNYIDVNPRKNKIAIMS
jgi:oxygen-dependent protoporphyrinogen oxidase